MSGRPKAELVLSESEREQLMRSRCVARQRRRWHCEPGSCWRVLKASTSQNTGTRACARDPLEYAHNGA